MEKLRRMLIGIAALALLALGWQVFHDQSIAAVAEMGAPALTQLSNLHAFAPISPTLENRAAGGDDMAEFQPYFMALKAALPTEYNKIVEKIVASDGEPNTGALDGVDTHMALAMRNVRESYGVLAGHADGPALDRILTAQQAILQEMIKDNVSLCVSFFYGGASPGFNDFSKSHRKLIAELGQSNLAAIVAGKANKNQPPEPSDADVQLLNDALVVAKVSPAAIDLLLDNKSPNPPLGETQMCQAGLDYLSALLGLSADVRWRLMSRSLILAARS